MALFDVILEFSDNQDMSDSATTYAATDVLDWVDSDLEMGAGEPLWLNVRVGTAIASGAGTATFAVALVRETNTDIDSSSVVIWSSRTIEESDSDLTAGTWLVRMPLPYNVDEDRYTGILYTIGNQTTSTGTIDAWIDHGPQSSYDTQVANSNI